jgi:7-cyano-7-deazaguanine synthase
MAPTCLLPRKALAALVSGGLDSAIMLAEYVRDTVVHPIYVRCGLAWEEAELAHARQFLAALHLSGVKPLQVLQLPVEDLYTNHWSLTGEGVPGTDTPDEAVFLPGRNVLLLAKAFLWCHLHGVTTLALAPLENNPFPDATPAFFARFQDAANQAVQGSIRILIPYRGLTKVDVLRRGRHLPLQFTFSCIRPVQGRHCGICNKCAERRRAFDAAGIPDPTVYVTEELSSS